MPRNKKVEKKSVVNEHFSGNWVARTAPLCWYNSPIGSNSAWGHLCTCITIQHQSVSKLSWTVCKWTFCVSEKYRWREWVHWSQLVSGHFSSSASSACSTCCDQPAGLLVGTVSCYFPKVRWRETKWKPSWKSALDFWHRLTFGDILFWTACFCNPWAAHVCKYILYHQHLNHKDHDHHDHDQNYNDHDHDDNEDDHDDHVQEVGLGVVGALAASVTEPLPGAALHTKTSPQVQCTQLLVNCYWVVYQVHSTAHHICTHVQC